MTAVEAAAAYDDDVVAQAQQLGLPGWSSVFLKICLRFLRAGDFL
jgi:hypothetical protein